MKPIPAAMGEDAGGEIAALVRNLHETQQRLEQLTGGGVDAVGVPGGPTYLLHEAQVQLRRSEAAQRDLAAIQSSILDALPAHIALIDQEGKIISVNEGWRHFAESNALQSADAGLGLNYLEICDRAQGNYAQEAPQAAAGIRAVITGAVREFSLEYPCHSPTARRWFQLMVAPLHGYPPSGAAVMHINITVRKQTDEMLQRRQTELRVLFDLMPAMIWFKDTKNCILRVNQRAADAAGMSVEAIEGKPSLEIYPQDAARFYADDLEVIRSAVPKLAMVETLRGPEGKELWVQTDKVPVCDPDGNVVGIFVMAQDITARKRADESLRESEERFAGAFEFAPIGMALVSPGGRWLKVNRALCRLVGYSEAELLTRTFQDISHPEDREVSAEDLRRLNAGEIRSFLLEKRYVHKRGHIVTTLLNVSLVHDGEGQPRHFVAQIQDITERKRAEAELIESKRFAESIAENSANIIYLFDLETGRNVYANRSVAEFLGYSPAQTHELGENLLQTIIHPEDLPRVGRHLADFAEVQDNRIVDIEYRVKHASGDWRWTWARDTVFNRRPNGAAWQILGTAQDITERKRTEESLRLLGSAVEQARESIMISEAGLNLPGPRIVFVNPAFTRMTGFTAEEAMGKTPRMLQGPRTDRTVLNRLRQNLERGEGFAGEAINYRKDGTEFMLEWQIAPLRDAGGKITHFVAIQRDITARKQAELELEQTHAQLLAVSREAGMAEFATGILHNVGNVLNSVAIASACVADSIQGSASANLAKVVALLKGHETDLGAFFTQNPKGRQVPAFLAQLAGQLADEQAGALKELDRLQRNIVHVRDIVTMQQGLAKKCGATEIVSLADLVEDALRMNLIEGAQHDIQVIKEFTDAPPVPLEEQKVLQILVNLVRNAQQSCEASGRPEKQLIIHTSVANGHVRIAVRDNGVGIPPENLARMFARGFTTKKHGHGFGLHSAAQTAKEMGGSLTVHSGGAGLGATFVLELPCQPQSHAQENS